MRTTNNFLVVPRIIFNTSIENYFFIVLIIIFRCIANLFLGLQCFAGLAVEVDWFESLTSLGDHFENFASGGVFSKRMPRRNIVRERNDRGFHLSYKICQEPVVCAIRDEVFWTEDLIEETTKGHFSGKNGAFKWGDKSIMYKSLETIGGGVFPMTALLGGSAQKGYLSQASVTLNMKG